MNKASLLSVNALRAWYGSAQILFNVSIEVARGEVVALMGRNGAGKSTTLKSIMGLVEHCEGEVRFLDKTLARREPSGPWRCWLN